MKKKTKNIYIIIIIEIVYYIEISFIYQNSILYRIFIK